MKVKTRLQSHLPKLFLCALVGIYYCCYNISLSLTNRRSLKLNQQITGYHSKQFIKGQCFIIEPANYGISQWGNSMYYYTSAIMYLLKQGASGVFSIGGEGTLGGKKQPKIPIGVPNLDGVFFGSNSTTTILDMSNCMRVMPQWVGDGKKGLKEGQPATNSMCDLMNVRDNWDGFIKMKGWPSGGKINPNPFVSDFGISPTVQEATKKLGVEWSDVLVVHIRQGDVMWLNQKRGDKMFGHSQPPCAYYEDVVETGFDGSPFPYLLIITNKVDEPLLVNPCDMFLDNKYRFGHGSTTLLDYNMVVSRMGSIQSHAGAPGENEGLRIDLHILSQAINFAEGHSTFTMGTTLLNINLKRHFFVANPSTINTVVQGLETWNGNWVHTRQFCTPGIKQTQYLLDDWLGHDASCHSYYNHGNRPLLAFIGKAGEKSRSWDREGTNFSNFMLEYKRSSMMKYTTSNKPFQCKHLPGFNDDSKWFIPCICDNEHLNV